ncbi:MAG TPA: mechanosensitive ion channel family protein [Terriglobia bacterium]|nr:mechanosensitive ion channel family protein [Terriglobia bacterium]
MKASRSLWLLVLLALAAATIVGLVFTGRGPNTATAPHAASGGSKGQPATAGAADIEINQQHLATARRLAALAATPEEQRLAADAVRAADAELDLAFSSALRSTSQASGPATPQTAEAEQRITRLGAEVQLDQDKLQQLAAAAKKAKESQQEALQGQIAVIQAELDLNQDALADAKQDLVRAGGDEHSRVQELINEHEAMEHANGSIQSPGSGSGAQSIFTPTSLIGQWRVWSELRSKRAELAAARDAALGAERRRSAGHQALEAQIEKERPRKRALAQQTASLLRSRQPAAQKAQKINSHQAAAAAVSSLRQLSNDEKNLAGLDKRAEDLHELGSIYGEWIALVAAAERAAVHGILWAVLWIILALLLVSIFHGLVERVFSHLTLEPKQHATLRALIRFVAQVVAVVVILFVIFGTPSQLSTIVGLATAGLTVALKDFIVSFLGWFVLMGRHGIRVGDWVEINGVRGEVVEIGLLRTVLLETGNWTDAGQPTGRQVAFLNSFAVEGYYFNFSTSGQWLWDELQVLIPSGQDPYPLIERIRDIAAKETEGNAHLAEQEWQRVTRRYGVGSFSAGPAVNIKATDLGVQVIVRYITRATERSEVRFRLNHAVVELLHGAKAPAAPLGETASAPPAGS